MSLATAETTTRCSPARRATSARTDLSDLSDLSGFPRLSSPPATET